MINSGFGEWTLTPPLNSNGQITLSYEISDGKRGDISTEILLTFDPVNDSPQLTSEAGILPNGLSNFPYEINRGYLSQGWEDPDGDDFNVFIRSVSVGKLFNNILILPSNYIGPVEIRYEVLDYTRAYNPVSLSFDILENNATVAPTDILLSRTHVDENTFPNQEIAEIFTQDPDIGETFKYTLMPTIDSNRFSIAANKLFLNESPNYEAKEKYFLRIRTTDRGGAGLSYEKDITINVIDINEEPSDFSIVSHFISVPENISWRESPALADLLITDDYINNCSIELVGDDADYFILKGNQLFLSSKALDYEEKTKLDLAISVQDFSIEGSKALTSNYSLNIDDVAENELVHRLRNPATGRFLFSSNKYEIDLLTGLTHNWIDEGISFFEPENGNATIYRFNIPSEGRHFYTSNPYERDLLRQLPADAGWNYEGAAFNALSIIGPPDNALPIVRYYSADHGHLYSSSDYEQMILDNDPAWINEGVAWYAFDDKFASWDIPD